MDRMKLYEHCTLCPRECGTDRTKHKGFCGADSSLRIARYGRHYWEEPPLSGKSGSGTVFFCSCSLKCVFCQNYEISHGQTGYEISTKELAEIFLQLQDKGANNIDLVTPTHFVPHILDSLDMVKGQLKIPVVYNCGGYESLKTLDMLKGYVDIFLPDLKYFDMTLAYDYSRAEDYFEKAIKAIRRMADMTGKPRFDENGLLKSGVIVRHLVLPNERHDSMNVIKALAKNFESDEILLSLMSQFTPTQNCQGIKKLNRRTTTFEYESVQRLVREYGFDGYFQERSSAKSEYIPEFFNNKKVTK
ncbi:MAG: radical SAM protein [Ruminococcus sp.]|nr:radical SAM protein [Ruminococcus sp.]